MLLSHQQKYILYALDALGCIRFSQLYELTRSAFSSTKNIITEAGMSAMLRQLVCGNYDILWKNDVVCKRHATVDLLFLESIDVMMEITDRQPDDFAKGKEPYVLLRFSSQQVYSIMHLTAEALARPNTVSPKEGEYIIWLSEIIKPEEYQNLPERQFFVQKGDDGVYHFYH